MRKMTSVTVAADGMRSRALASAWRITGVMLVLQGATLLPFAAASAVYAPNSL